MNNDNGKKAAIRNAAKQLFFHFGFAKTSMDDIARQSGLAKPSLYYYYENKETLFEDVILDEVDIFLAAIVKKIPHDLNADLKLIQYLQHFGADIVVYVEKIKQTPCIMETYYPHGRPVMAQMQKKMENQIELILREGINQKVFYQIDIKKYTKAIAYMTQFLNVQWIIDHKHEDIKSNIEAVIDIILNGIRRRV